jgi:DNA mismatch repair protein MutL
MSDIIHLLPDSVANQIAAGEVIQRPASVLKELVENAIDAGAKSIAILIKDAGRTLIQVTDNGKGMSETDARMAFERHATSKIKEASDLFMLHTMGFRGEALASIAAIAQVELRTRKADDELGTLIEIAGTRVFKQENVQCDAGTSFLVKNLFFNVPARRRFLKSDNVEKSHLLTEFYRIVLVNPDVEFSFFDGDEELYRLPISNIKIRIDNVFGKSLKKKIQQQLLTIESNTNLVTINGFIGKPEFIQKSPIQYFFVNGRYMRHPYFHKAVTLAYNQIIQASESPNYFIYFELDPQSIDINIHPTKTEIKFENEQAIWSILSATIKEALGKFNIVPSINFDQEGAIDIPVTNISLENIHPPKTNFNPDYNPFSSSYKRPNLNWEELYGGFSTDRKESIDPDSQSIEHDFESESIEKSYTIPSEQKRLEEFDSIQTSNYQFKNRFILTNVKSGLLIIDQHRAHTRILFNQILNQIQQAKSISQQILFPEVLELSTDDVLFFNEIREELQAAGFDFEINDENSFLVKGIPAQLGAVSVLDLLFDLLEKVRSTNQSTTLNMHEKIALALAQASAIKNGKYLANEEMNNLIDNLFACENHSFTPDGKKVMSIFSNEEIEKRLN